MMESIVLFIMRGIVIFLFINPAFLGALFLFWIASGFQITPCLVFDCLWNP